MKLFARTLVFLIAGCACAFAADRNALTFTNYDLHAVVTPSNAGFAVKGAVTLRNDSPQPQRYAVLQVSSSLEWQHITVGGEEVQFLAQPYTTDIDHTGAVSEVTVTLPKLLEPRQSVTLNVEYGGAIAPDAKRLTRIGTPDEDALRSDWDQVSTDFTGVRGLGFVTWYPVAIEAVSLSEGNTVFDALADWRRRNTGAQMHVSLCVPSKEATGDVIVANGKESPAAQDSDAAQTCKSYDYTLAPLTVPAFVIGPLKALERQQETIYHIQSHTTAAEDYATEFERLQTLAAQWLGGPKDHAVFVEVTGRAGSPYETGALMFAPLGQGDKLNTDVAAAYQLAQISKRSFRPWIDYGLAHFLQFLTVEQETGRNGGLHYLSQYGGPLASADKTPSEEDAKARSLINTDDELFYRAKSLYVWSMLRDMIGDQVLASAIEAYQSADDHDASYMQKLIETRAKKNLEWFFDDWVYRDRWLPDFHIVSAYPRQILGGQFITTITIENLGHAAAEVPVSAIIPGGERTVRIVVKPGEQASARINTLVQPTEVVVNDGSVPESDLNNNTFKITTTAAPPLPPIEPPAPRRPQ